MGRRLVASDIHGEGHRLLQALEKADYKPGVDRLFLLGDYIDRGTDPRRTVEIVQELQKEGAVVLRGNHEAMALEAAKSQTAWRLWTEFNGGDVTVQSYGGELPQDVLGWFASLPLYHEEPDDVLLVHAGIRPGIPLEEQKEEDLLWIRGEFYHFYKGDWLVIFGHTPTPFLHGLDIFEPWFGYNMIGIDTAAAYGGVLTLLDIDTCTTWTA